jgi:hypothetical protein
MQSSSLRTVIIPLGIIVLSVLVVVGDVGLMYATKNIANRWMAGVVAAFWASEVVPWYFIMQQANLSYLGVVYSVVVMIGLVVGGVILFADKLSLYQVAGIGFGVVALILMQWGA